MIAAEGEQNEEGKSTNGDTAKKPKLDDEISKDEKNDNVSQEIMPVSMVAHVVGNLTNEMVFGCSIFLNLSEENILVRFST